MIYRQILKIISIAFVLCWAQSLKAQYLQADEVIVANRPVTLSIPNTDTLLVTYRPGSNISETVPISVTDSTFKWTPREAGIVALSTPGGATQNVSVRFDSFPLSGLIILLAAGTILFGGALIASVKLFGKESSKQITARPDT